MINTNYFMHIILPGSNAVTESNEEFLLEKEEKKRKERKKRKKERKKGEISPSCRREREREIERKLKTGKTIADSP